MTESFLSAELELVKTSNNLPLPIQKALEKIQDLVDSISKSRPEYLRAMRPERKKNLAKFLTALIMSVSLQHKGTICQINGEWVRPKTLAELGAQAGISYTAAKRCLASLKQLGFITSKQIRRKNVYGQLEVSPGLRAFTPKFWEALGLWEIFQQSMAWAKKNCKRLFKMAYKTIKNIGTWAKADTKRAVKDMAAKANEYKKRAEENKKPPVIINDGECALPLWKKFANGILERKGIEKPPLNE